LVLMPTSVEPLYVAVTFLITTLRLPWPDLQLPHERYSLPKSWTWNPSMMTVPPGPLCWMTLSEACSAPPPLIVMVIDAEVGLNVAASSPTSSHQTFCRVHVPSQCTPSAAGLPMMTFFRVPPLGRSKIGSWPSCWLPLPSLPVP